MAEQATPLLRHTDTSDPTSARVTIDLDTRGDTPVEPKLFGKFSEHLGLNILHGMEAQILFNPTFGEWHFRGDDRTQSGGFFSENDPEKIEAKVENHVRSLAYPEDADADAMLDAYRAGLAYGWVPTDPDAVTCSPDTGPNGNRAQRVQTDGPGQGVAQETHLPLHRVHEYEFRTQLRAVEPTTVTLAVTPRDGDAPVTSQDFVVDTDWQTVEDSIDLPADVDPDSVYEVSLTAEDSANFVVERALLYPGDHVNYADPEIVELLRESDLPLLRWPGGNFVSGYDWTDGIGPVDDRPTKPNPAWEGLEYNLFGTAEFIEFCEAVDCEPSICVNAGDGTPAEAAAWVEYCNGDPEETELGALRAEHGYEEPFDITYWEIGNELYGPWQVHWTTPGGNADRYLRFKEAMKDADPGILVTATGQETNHDGSWNDVLLEEAGDEVRAVSEHILGGGVVGPDTDPDELFHAFMGFPNQLREQFDDLRSRMEAAGIDDPKLDITELQVFAHYNEDATADDAEAMGRDDSVTAEQEGRLSPETMPTPVSITEALYDACVRHECIRMGDFVELLTHSATVNHGGGLQKQYERVWADPCHYGRAMGTALADGTPVGVDLACDTISTETTFREIRPVDGVPAVDAMAAHHEDDDELVVLLVNRASADDAVSVTLDTGDFDAADEAEMTVLAADELYEQNSRENPEHVTPETHTVAVDSGETTVDLPSYGMARLTFEDAV